MQSLAPRLAKLNELIGDVPGLMAPTPPKLLAPVLLPGQQGSGVPGMPDPAAVAAAAFIPGKIGNAFQPGAMLAPTGMLSPGKLGGMFFPGARPAPVAATPGGFGAQPAPVAATPSGFGGGIGQATGEYSVLNQYDPAFTRASAKYGIPANVLKAIAMNERGWEGTSPDGALGIMQVMPQFWGDLGYDLNDPTGNIMAGAAAYKSFYDQYHDEAVARGVDPWVAAAGAYLSGNPWSTSADSFGTTASTYEDAFGQHLSALGGMGGGTGTPQGGVMAPSGSSAFSSIWGGGDAPITQGFGAYGGPDLYGYGIGHGLDGKQHTGIDVGVPRGTTLYAPISGTVVCSGTGNGPGAHGSGCAAFNDADGGGAGRVEIVSDDGRTSIILGHASAALLAPGTHVGVGQAVAKSGGEYGDHVHVEARVWSNGDYTIVDPTSVLGAATGGTVPQPGMFAPGTAPVASGPGLIGGMTPGDRMRQLLNGW
jgi:murein DD-endopeptidase MepM/ murein hydrolase activator NlpD